MNEIIKNIEAEQLKKDVPQFNVGDTVRVHALIKEGNRERIQIFEGTVRSRPHRISDRTGIAVDVQIVFKSGDVSNVPVERGISQLRRIIDAADVTGDFSR